MSNHIPWQAFVTALTLLIEPSIFFAADSAEEQSGIYKGTILAVNLNAQTVTVERAKRSKQFTVTSQTSITTQEKKGKATLADLREGFDVEVAYSEKDGVAEASSIAEQKSAREKK